MVLLKIADAASGKGVGMLNWFSVHGTSMNNTNTLVSGDNKGYAEMLFEGDQNGAAAMPGDATGFVAAFAQSNEGDVSPNTYGPHCLDTGLPCETEHSTCNGRNELCVASGPGINGDMFESTQIIGQQQHDAARLLYDDDAGMVDLDGTVDYRHAFVDMGAVTLPDPARPAGSNRTVKTCTPAMGYSFAAGTTDGPGALNFTQGTTSSNPFWNFVTGLLHKPSAALKACHHPKPILLDTGKNHPFLLSLSVCPQLTDAFFFKQESLPSRMTGSLTSCPSSCSAWASLQSWPSPPSSPPCPGAASARPSARSSSAAAFLTA
jgi:neutral ceramidase